MFSISAHLLSHMSLLLFFFFNDPATTEIYTLSLHDALPIWVLAIIGRSASYPAAQWAGAREVAERFGVPLLELDTEEMAEDRKSTRLNSSHVEISYAVFCLKKKKKQNTANYLKKTTSRYMAG